MFHILFSLLSAKYIFFWFYQSVRFEAKNVLGHARITSSFFVLKWPCLEKAVEMLRHGKFFIQ